MRSWIQNLECSLKRLDKKRVTVCELKEDGSQELFLSALGDKEQGSE